VPVRVHHTDLELIELSMQYIQINLVLFRFPPVVILNQDKR
jgi:hypothetical protein